MNKSLKTALLVLLAVSLALVPLAAQKKAGKKKKVKAKPQATAIVLAAATPAPEAVVLTNTVADTNQIVPTPEPTPAPTPTPIVDEDKAWEIQPVIAGYPPKILMIEMDEEEEEFAFKNPLYPFSISILGGGDNFSAWSASLGIGITVGSIRIEPKISFNLFSVSGTYIYSYTSKTYYYDTNSVYTSSNVYVAQTNNFTSMQPHFELLLPVSYKIAINHNEMIYAGLGGYYAFEPWDTSHMYGGQVHFGYESGIFVVEQSLIIRNKYPNPFLKDATSDFSPYSMFVYRLNVGVRL